MSSYSDFHYGRDQLANFDQHRHPTTKQFEMPEGSPITRQTGYRDYLIVQNESTGQFWKVTAKDGKDAPGIAGLFTKVHLAEDAIERYYSDIEKTKQTND